MKDGPCNAPWSVCVCVCVWGVGRGPEEGATAAPGVALPQVWVRSQDPQDGCTSVSSSPLPLSFVLSHNLLQLSDPEWIGCSGGRGSPLSALHVEGRANGNPVTDRSGGQWPPAWVERPLSGVCEKAAVEPRRTCQGQGAGGAGPGLPAPVASGHPALSSSSERASGFIPSRELGLPFLSMLISSTVLRLAIPRPCGVLYPAHGGWLQGAGQASRVGVVGTLTAC